GVDVRSRMDIYRMLRASAKRGLAVTLVSSDASELAGFCDRILVVSRGKIVAELPGKTATEEGIVHAFTGAGHAAETDAVGEDRPAALPAADASGPTVGRLREFAHSHENLIRLLLLVLLLFGLGAYARSSNS